MWHSAQAGWTNRGAFARKLRAEPGRVAAAGWGTVGEMKDSERNEAVEAHLDALDDEIARLRKMEAALDRRIEAAEEERRAIEQGPPARADGAPPPGEDAAG